MQTFIKRTIEFCNNHVLQIMTIKLAETSNNVKLTEINTGDLLIP